MDAALELTRRVLQTSPLWIRSFADLEADEVNCFANSVATNGTAKPIVALVPEFAEVSQLTERHILDPESFVRFAFDPRTRTGLSELANKHADVINQLSRAVADGQMTKELSNRALRSGLRALLSRGSDRTAPLLGTQLDEATRLCFKHHKCLMRECRAYATEFHLADYRTASPKRVARSSDSMDLMLATAAFPYVSAFVTNDGYLHGALSYVLTRLPCITTELIRSPPRHAA